MTEVRTRFCPSPTGIIHLGNARTALFSALYAKKSEGVFVLRIEDTDVSRSEERYVESLQENMHWLGLAWQEGPGVGGAHGPYWQSQRQSIYEKYYRVLEEKKRIYPCFCSDQTLALSRKLQLSRGQAPRYAGSCLKLSAEEIAARLAAGERPAWRFSVPVKEAIEFVDMIKGPQCFQSDDIGDFIVRRADGTAPFLFCNAIDDAEMKVSHVLRGEDHLANTPRQLMILESLGLFVPTYGHLSMIVGEDGAPLSKRHGSFSVDGIRDEGYLAIAVMNYLARLGHATDNQQLLPFDALAKHFDIGHVSKSPARFDNIQLLYWQKMAVQSLSNDAFWRWVGESVKNQVPEAMSDLFATSVKANIAFPHDALLWAKIFFHDSADIEASELALLKEAGEQFFVTAELMVDKYGLDLSTILNEMKHTLGVQGKKLFMPLRIALTGRVNGPELVQIVGLLGQQKVKHRLGQAVKRVSQ
ncbi:MAG TPA: glutamate--tRNA ligase [Gammaproteobacteria bacterium]|jgi:glutamyl-tRNA synthetase|nr:glutamate--tRNA ligase [Gammaproteobacteria bacterium]